jgi:hypothetical protein
MPKWEYKLVVNGILGSLLTEIPAFLNEQGEEGWELVLSSPEYLFIFKRPLPPPQP